MLQKISISNPEKNVSWFPQNYELFSALIIIKNVFWAANTHIKMISERSCDTEDWSNDAENAGINYMLTYIQITNSYFKFKKNISQYYCFYCIFGQINGALVSIRVLFQKH